MKKRAVSPKMMESLLSGTLQPVLEAVQRDDTLCMELQGDFVSVYQRENNLQKAAGRTTDYFFLDMACEDSSRKFDMVAIKWPEKSRPRRKHLPPTLALTEIVYDNALLYSGEMKEYLSDLNVFLSDQEQVRAFLEDMSEVFSQKCRLGLIRGVQERLFDTNILPETPEIIFVCVHQKATSRGVDVLIHDLDIGAYNFPVLAASSSIGLIHC